LAAWPHFDVFANSDHHQGPSVMSGSADRELIREAITLGAFDYLHKPLSVDRVPVTATSGIVRDRIGRRSSWNTWKTM
jgi:DNA-binding NtrC family response regulator